MTSIQTRLPTGGEGLPTDDQGSGKEVRPDGKIMLISHSGREIAYCAVRRQCSV